MIGMVVLRRIGKRVRRWVASQDDETLASVALSAGVLAAMTLALAMRDIVGD